MKNYILTLAMLFLVILVYAQSPVGAWETTFKDEEGKEMRVTVIFTNKYQVATWYDAQTGVFLSTNGGTWSLEGSSMKEVVEFDSKKPERVGTTVAFEVELTNSTLQIKGGDKIFKRLDSGTPGELEGAWLMSGRKRGGEIQLRKTDQPRKTMKILSGTRFQWIAYNTETKEFMATGGGNYTTVDGKYTENIEFFSKDKSRVGAKLEFDFSVLQKDWHHSGFSSKGDPLYEIWSVRMK